MVTYTTSHVVFRGVCDKLGGRLPMPTDAAALNRTHDDILVVYKDIVGEGAPADACFADETMTEATFLAGQVYDHDAARWTDPYTGLPITNDTATPRPNDAFENCAFAWGRELETKECDVLTTCGVCLLEHKTRILMKGLCKRNTGVDQDYDHYYFIRGQRNGRTLFHGVKNSAIFFDPKAASWRLQSLRNPEKFLTMENPVQGRIPIGTHTWVSGSRGAVCGEEEGSKHELTFSTCYPDKYTCNDGTCIPLE